MGCINPELMQHGSPRVTVTDCGAIVKYQLTSYKPKTNDDGENLPPYIYLDSDNYVSLKTGEIKQFEKSDVKGDNQLSLKRSFARLRDLINTNFDDPEKVLFVTFTYAPEKLRRLGSKLTLKKVSKDMRNMFARMKESGIVSEFRYIYVVEQQGNGNWHTHCLLFFDDKPPYIETDVIEGWWKQGFVWISKRFEKDEEFLNVGAYICAYLTDDATDKHKIVKNARLMNYPTNTHLYRCSANIRRPKKYDISFDQAKIEIPSEETRTYEKINDVEIERDVRHMFQYLHFRRVMVTLQDIGVVMNEPRRMATLLNWENSNNLNYVNLATMMHSRVDPVISVSIPCCGYSAKVVFDAIIEAA